MAVDSSRSRLDSAHRKGEEDAVTLAAASDSRGEARDDGVELDTVAAVEELGGEQRELD